MANSLEYLRAAGTVIVSDSGEFEIIEAYNPTDATTNPSLILAAITANNKTYNKIFDDSVAEVKTKGGDIEQQANAALDRVLVRFGVAIFNILKRTDKEGRGGRVSTEVDARLSYDKEATKAKARAPIALYEEHGVDRSHVLIKIASTWEGIQAARELERESIHCNLTLLFGFEQAVACAEAGVTLISPFVARITDWYKQHAPVPGEEEPGVPIVRKIFDYYKQYGYRTHIMGASLRTVSQIKALAGLDYLTIPPKLLEELRTSYDEIPQKFIAEAAKLNYIPKLSLVDNEAEFRWQLHQDTMAFEQLYEGIKVFARDGAKIKELLKEKLRE